MQYSIFDNIVTYGMAIPLKRTYEVICWKKEKSLTFQQ